MENEKLTLEQIEEVNARVKEIIETFVEGLCNSSAFDYNGYVTNSMVGNVEIGEAQRYVYETKARIVGMIRKEVELTCQNDESVYFKKKREVKDEIITSFLQMLTPALKGRTDREQFDKEQHYTQRAANLAEFALNKGEDLNKIQLKHKNFQETKQWIKLK